MVAATAACSVSLALLNWSLSIIGGALIARECGQQARKKQWELHYPLLCAAGYSGMMVWHGGLSGTAPLKVTRIADLQDLVDASEGTSLSTTSLQETIFSPLNLYTNVGLFILAVVGFYFLTPTPGQDPQAMAAPELVHETTPRDHPPASWTQRWAATGLGLALGSAFVAHLLERGISRLDLNLVNLGLWSLSRLAHKRLDQWLASVDTNIRGCAGILIQFPLYAGMMNLLMDLGLTQTLSQWMSQLSHSMALLFTFINAAILNIFVPSPAGDSGQSKGQCSCRSPRKAVNHSAHW